MIRLRHHRQDFAASCLAACVRMALTRWGISKSEAELRRLLKINSHVGGHPISLLDLRSLGILSYVDSGTIEDLRTHVDGSEPVL